FEAHQLPQAAQLSSVNAIQVFDYNQDAYPDVLLGGNLYQAEVETPRADAGIGLVLIGKAGGGFEPEPATQSGLMITGEVKHIRPILMGNGQAGFVFARNDLPLGIFSFQPARPQ
ncbi:MAG: hypothetical protein AAFV07_07975, partial [Bacteroidota bacterium]